MLKKLIIIITLLFYPLQVYSTSGGLDGYGCHNGKNKGHHCHTTSNMSTNTSSTNTSSINTSDTSNSTSLSDIVGMLAIIAVLYVVSYVLDKKILNKTE